MPRKLKRVIKAAIQNRKVKDLPSLEKSQFFCIKPWTHLFVSHFGTVVPCCLTPWEKEQALGDINEQTVPEIWNAEPIRQLRIKMLKDEPDSRCKQCYENEKVGLRSSRHINNFLYANHIDWVLDTALDGSAPDSKPVTWDIRISNLCNFKCRICGHHSSSQWYEDAKALGLLSHDTRLHNGVQDFDRLLKQLDFVVPDLEEIYFAGGEPLMMDGHYQILERLIEKGKTDMRLCYATNFSQTRYKGKDLFALWSHFKEVNVYASLDGSAARGELQRSGQVWEQAVKNRQRLIEQCPHVDFLITPTINVFNVLHLPDFHREWTEMGLIQIDQMMPHTLRHPQEYNVAILPPALKQQVTQKLNKHIDWIIEYAKKNPPPPPSAKKLEKAAGRLDWITAEPVTGHIQLDMVINEFKGCLSYMNSKDDSALIPQFKKMCLALDELRKEDTAKTFPELQELFM